MSDIVATHRLTERAILKMLKTGVEKARELNAPVAIGIVDAGGNLRAYVLMDGAPALAHDAVIKKARSAAYTGRPSGGLPEELGLRLGLAISDFANLPGGFPALKDGDVLGAVAAGGGTHEQDAAVAQAALDALDLG